MLRALLGRWLATGELPSAPDESQASLLVEAASEQGLAGLLRQAIGQQSVRWPDAARRALRRADQEAFALGVRQLETANRVQHLLGARGLRCLPLKGAALAERLYDSVAHRPMADIDLLVLDDWPQAVTLLQEAGFAEHEQADHARAFLDPASGTVVELHQAVVSCARLFPLDLDAACWSESLPISPRSRKSRLAHARRLRSPSRLRPLTRWSARRSVRTSESLSPRGCLAVCGATAPPDFFPIRPPCWSPPILQSDEFVGSWRPDGACP